MIGGLGQRQKPPIGTPLDRSAAIGAGLIFFAPFWEGTGAGVYDIISGYQLLPLASGVTTWVAGGSGDVDSALQLNTSTLSGVQVTLPSELKIQAPCTMVGGYRYLGSGANGNYVMSMPVNNSGASPYNAFGLRTSSAGTMGIIAQNGATGASSFAGYSMQVGRDEICVAVFGLTTYTIYGFALNGSLIAYATGSYGYTANAIYGATALMAFGAYSGNLVQPHFAVNFGMLFNRALSAPEATSIAAYPWQVFKPPFSINILGASLIASYSLSGPSSGEVNVASTNFTVACSNPVSDTITFSDGGKGGTFTPSSLTITSGSSHPTFTYTPAATGTITLTLTSANATAISGSPATYASLASQTITFAGPTKGSLGATSTNFTLTPVGNTTDTATPSDGGAAGTFSPTSISWSGSSNAQTFTYTSATSGAIPITITTTLGATVTGSPITYTSNPYVLDNFTDSNGTPLTGANSHQADSGAYYSVYGSIADGGTRIESNSAYGDTLGTRGFCISDLLLSVNQVASVTFTYNSSATSGDIEVIVRAQSAAFYSGQITLQTCEFFIQYVGGSTYHSVNSFTPSGVFANGAYTMSISDIGNAIELYISRGTDGKFYSPYSNAWQAAKVAVTSCGHNSILTSGYPGFVMSTASGMTGPCPVTQFAAGPNVFLPPDIGSSFQCDTKININVLEFQRGYTPVTAVLQRRVSGVGGFVTIGPIYPDITYYDSGLTASTAYDYQVIATDAKGNTSTSVVLTVSTRATETITPPTLYSYGNTAWNNGSPTLDSNGYAINGVTGHPIWSTRYQCYFLSGLYCTATTGPIVGPQQALVYGSKDLVNWTQLSGGGNLGGSPCATNTVNGVTYNYACFNIKVYEHPTNGMYYMLLSASSTDPSTYTSFMLGPCSTPWGTFPYLAAMIGPGYNTNNSVFIDYDGSSYFVKERGPFLATLASDWSSIGTLYGGGQSGSETTAIFRKGRTIWTGVSLQTGVIPNANYAVAQAAYDNPSAGQATYPNASMMPTGSPPAPQSGAYAYGTQTNSVLRLPGGQHVWYNDEWTYSTLEPGQYNWMMATSFDSLDEPIVPYEATFSITGYTLTGPSSGTNGVPSTNFTITPAGTITDIVTFGDGVQGGTFTPTQLVFSASSVAQTFTYTPAVVGALSLTATSANGGTIANSPKSYISNGTGTGGGGGSLSEAQLQVLAVLGLQRRRKIKDLPTVPGYRAKRRRF